MDTDLTKIQDLIERPRESLAVELKRWIDPDQRKRAVDTIFLLTLS